MSARRVPKGAVPAMLILVLVLGFAPSRAQAAAPMDLIRDITERVLEVLRTYPASGSSAAVPIRREAIRKIVDAHFEREEMSKRVLGRHWKQQPPEKQQEFVELFYWRLYNFYILRVETYSDEKVEYRSEQIQGDRAQVKTRISSSKNPEFDLDYRLLLKDGQWKVYDVVIEGVSLISNYREQFNSILGRQSFDELLQQLREKVPADHKEG